MSTGKIYETAAADLVTEYGLRILNRNFSCKAGEIDLICQDSGQLVFVEVRRRSNPRFGSAAASVTISKQRKLIRAARFYLQSQHSGGATPCRFDVIAFDRHAGGQERVQWIKNAFTM